MTNNDILRRLRFIFELSDSQISEISAQAGKQVAVADVSRMLKSDDDPELLECSDHELATFLNGFINFKRGKREGPGPEPETTLTNNAIFQKLKIALDLKADDILEILGSVHFVISKHELTALFRKQGHKHYRECKDQLLRNFLKGLQLKLRGAC
jgi:uncharacterized protein YehS (DUF1456 family)